MSLYEDQLPLIRQVAREHGYAVGFHGTGERDCDLIACPWVEWAEPAEYLIEAIRRAVDGVILEGVIAGRAYENPAHRPHGRRAWAIQIGAGRYFDISVIPCLK